MAARAVGFVGLGVMGAPMAGHLLRAGHRVTVWNRTPSKSEPLREQGAIVAPTLAALAGGCELLITCVTRTEDVEACVAQLAPAAAPNTLFIDHSTIAPEGADRIHQALRGQGHRFVDAPITGGSMGAQRGQLTVFCGGDEADVDEALPVLAAYAKRAERVGGPGAGQRMKLANQIAVGGALLALCECLAFAEKAGLDLAQARELIGSGAAGSWAFENYGPKVLARDWSPGFSIDNQRKDFGYCRDEAARLDAAIPATELADRLLGEMAREGKGDRTTAALFEALLEAGFDR